MACDSQDSPRSPKIHQANKNAYGFLYVPCTWLPGSTNLFQHDIYHPQKGYKSTTLPFFVMEIDLSHPVTKIVISISLLSAHTWPRHRLLLDCRQGCGFGQACGTEDKLCLELLESHRGITGEIPSHTLFETKEKSVTISLSLFGNHFFHGLV